MPRKLSAEEAISAAPIACASISTSGGATFGSTWRRSRRGQRTPTTRAAATYSEPSTLADSVCVRRAACGAPAIASATTIPAMPGPMIVTISSTSRIPGNATSSEIEPATPRRSRGPVTSGSNPSATPSVNPSVAVTTASASEMRVATSTRASMSRPSASVPNGCASVAPSLSAPRLTASARPPQISGANSASSTNAASTPSTTTRNGER